MYKAVKTNCVTLLPEIVDVDFEIREYENLAGQWIHVVKGGVTGYESADVHKLAEKLAEKNVFASWVACGGTLNKYNRLDIPMSEIIKYLEDQELIEVEREYGYIKKVTWKNDE